jgi:signal peptidase I
MQRVNRSFPQLSCRRLPILEPRLLRLLGGGALAIVAATVLPLRVGVADGRSMEPTLKNGWPFLFAAAHRGSSNLRRRDVVVVRLYGRTCVKRILALSGDRFWSMTPREVQEPYRFLPPGSERELPRWKRRFPRLRFDAHRVPPGHVFVLGDGPTSLDSRQLGPVAEAEVIGRVIAPNSPAPPPGSLADGELPVQPHGLGLWLAQHGWARVPASTGDRGPAVP